MILSFPRTTWEREGKFGWKSVGNYNPWSHMQKSVLLHPPCVKNGLKMLSHEV